MIPAYRSHAVCTRHTHAIARTQAEARAEERVKADLEAPFFSELAKVHSETQAQARVVQLRDQMLQAVVNEEVDAARRPWTVGADDG